MKRYIQTVLNIIVMVTFVLIGWFAGAWLYDDGVDQMTTWLERHDTTVDLFTVWAVVISAAIIAAGLFIAWWTLRDTHDQTDIGRTLKWQNVSLSVALLANGLYWGAVLLAFYTGYIVDIWEKTILRLVFAGGMLIGAVFVMLFVRALRSESGSGHTGEIPLAHDEDVV